MKYPMPRIRDHDLFQQRSWLAMQDILLHVANAKNQKGARLRLFKAEEKAKLEFQTVAGRHQLVAARKIKRLF